MTMDPMFKLMLAAVIGFVFKIVYDWLKIGRLEKGIYMKAVDCEANRDKCCLPQLKRDLGVFDNRLGTAEKSLDRGREDFQLLRKDIGGIKESVAGIKIVLETFLKERN